MERKCFVFLLKILLNKIYVCLYVKFVVKFSSTIFGSDIVGGERKKEREDQIIPIMHVGFNSNYFPNFACGLDH
jgi:hypothetical protein